jgi:hypothetical protein
MSIDPHLQYSGYDINMMYPTSNTLPNLGLISQIRGGRRKGMKVTLSRYEYSYIYNKFMHDPAHMEMERCEFAHFCGLVCTFLEYEINLLESAERMSNSSQYMVDKWVSLQDDIQWVKYTMRRINANGHLLYVVVNKTTYDRMMILWFNL